MGRGTLDFILQSQDAQSRPRVGKPDNLPDCASQGEGPWRRRNWGGGRIFRRHWRRGMEFEAVEKVDAGCVYAMGSRH